MKRLIAWGIFFCLILAAGLFAGGPDTPAGGAGTEVDPYSLHTTGGTVTGPATFSSTLGATGGFYSSGQTTLASTTVNGITTFTAPIYLSTTTAALPLEPVSLDELLRSIPGNLTYYLSTMTNDVSGARTLASAPVAAFSFDSGAIAVGPPYTLWASWTTELGQPDITTLPQGVYSFHLHCQKTGGKAMHIVRELWTRTAGGVYTFVASSSAFDIAASDNTAHEEVVSFVTTSDITIAATDRLQVRAYGYATGGGAASTMILSGGGANQSFFTLPATRSEVCARTNGSNITATDTFRANIGAAALGSNTFNAAQSLIVASSGYLTTQGNSWQFAAGSSSVLLPIDGAVTALTPTASFSYFWDATITEKQAASLTASVFRLRGAFSTLGANNPLSQIGSDISESWIATESTGILGVSASYAGGQFRLLASGPVTSLWQVKSLRIGGF